MRNYREKRRRIRRYLIIVCASIVLVAGLVIAASVMAVRMATPVVAELKNSEPLKNLQQAVPKSIEQVPALLPQGCLRTLQGLVQPAPWLERPLVANFRVIQQSCFPAEEQRRSS